MKAKTVLLVENTSLSETKEKKPLAKLGYHILKTATDDQALETLQKTPGIDLVLVAIEPENHTVGLRTAETILRDRDLPVVLLVSDLEPEFVESLEKVTPYGFVDRNASSAILTGSINVALRLHQAGITPKSTGHQIGNTDRKQVEEALRESEARLNSILMAVPDMISVHDKAFNILYSNWKIFADVPVDKRIIGSKCYHTYRGFDDVCPDCNIKHVFETQKPYETEAKLGSGRWIDFRVLPVFNREGVCVQYVEWVREITDRKLAEETLRQSEARLRSYFESQVAAIAIIRPGGELIEVNEYLCELFGYNREELSRLTWIDLTHPDDVQTEKKQFEEVVDNRANGYRLEKRFLRKNGTVIWANMSVSFVRNEEGSVALLIALIVDITQRKLAEAELQRQLAEKELLLRETHHRIKNHMNSVVIMLSMKARSASNPEAVSILNQAIARVISMADLYDKMLISVNYQQVTAASYLSDLADSVIALFSEMVMVTVDKRFDEFSLEPKKLYFLGVILNELLTNAMKFAFEGKPSGRVSIAAVNIKERVTLTVRDDGNGLPPGFDIETPGRFGLVLVKMLSQLLEGVFQIESAAGTVCTLTFRL